jgi:transposase
MGASSYTFACATPAETMEDWLGGIARALTFYGGVPQLIVPDNPRAMIADPDRYEPRAGDTVLDFARHYGTSFLPARVYCPRDKPKVEVAVQVVERWIMARLRPGTAHLPWHGRFVHTRSTATTKKAPGEGRLLARHGGSGSGLRPFPLPPCPFSHPD